MTTRYARARSVEPAHGPKDAYYSFLPDSVAHPVIECLCGWMPQTIADS